MSFLTDFFAGSRSLKGTRASFTLIYNPTDDAPLAIGSLTYDGATWFFQYDEAYKRRTDLRPLEGFDDLNKIYSSPRLFPFFQVRLPDQDRPDIRRKMASHNMHDPDEVEMLRVFGRKAASSPGYELVAQ